MNTQAERLRIPDNLLVKEKDGKYLVFNPNKPSWLVTNAVGVNILQLCNGERNGQKISELLPLSTMMNEAEIEDFLRIAVEKQIFVSKRSAYSQPRFPLRSAYFNITEACNLRCTYCYAEEREKTEKRLSLDDYRNIIQEIKLISQQPSIVFTGGEPLLSPLLMDVAHYAKEMGMRTLLLTNGTLISKDNVEKIHQLFDGVKISLDGSCPDVNDRTRGAGVFDRVMESLVLLDKVGQNYILSTTVTRKNIHDIGAMQARFGGKLGFAPYFHRSADELNSDLAITGAQYYQALTEVRGVNPYRKIETVVWANMNNHVIQKCAIADGSISIAANGDVFPCQLLHFEEFKAGNLFASSLKSVYATSPELLRLRELTVDKIDGCTECPISLVCGGGCFARNYYETGKIDKAGEFCEYEQLGILDALIDQYEL